MTLPLWTEVSKSDVRCRVLADRHYSRQTIGHVFFTRPGYNQVLYYEDRVGPAVWVWFRPKWESGIKGTMRKDGLLAIECTLFRNESGARSSDLIETACIALTEWPKALDIHWPDGAITGIKTSATAARRSKHNLPGHCYREAGWKEFEHNKSKRADVWLKQERSYFL